MDTTFSPSITPTFGRQSPTKKKLKSPYARPRKAQSKPNYETVARPTDGLDATVTGIKVRDQARQLLTARPVGLSMSTRAVEDKENAHVPRRGEVGRTKKPIKELKIDIDAASATSGVGVEARNNGKSSFAMNRAVSVLQRVAEKEEEEMNEQVRKAFIPARLPRPPVQAVDAEKLRKVLGEAFGMESATPLESLNKLKTVSSTFHSMAQLYVPAPPSPTTYRVSSTSSSLPPTFAFELHPSLSKERIQKTRDQLETMSITNAAPSHCLAVGPVIRLGRDQQPRNQDECGRLIPVHYAVYASYCSRFPELKEENENVHESMSGRGQPQTVRTPSSSSTGSRSSSGSVTSSSTETICTSSSVTIAISNPTISAGAEHNATSSVLPSQISLPIINISVPYPSVMPLIHEILYEPLDAKVLGKLLDVESVMAESTSTANQNATTRPRGSSSTSRERARRHQETDSSDDDPSSRRSRHLSPPPTVHSAETTPLPSRVPSNLLTRLSTLPPAYIFERLSIIHKVWSNAVHLGVSDPSIWTGMGRAWEIYAGLLMKKAEDGQRRLEEAKKLESVLERRFKRTVSLVQKAKGGGGDGR